ncbi:hypothetical protein CRUP_028590 [Coryphaenoides rupestris]|nr:hypothetical protein CRUP_028590 [Coryphaenoides rupestris]
MKLKSKSSYHKSENTYRFLTFAERLANVNIDVIHRIDRTGTYDEEVDTYFFQGLTKWRDLNLTEHFLALMRDVFNHCQTFNLLVFHQKAVVCSLKAHLAVKNSLAYQPLLDLVTRLARDLQTDFYPHFPEFFLLITPLLETKDTEVLEWVFTSLSYLYKYLWRLMVRDMGNIYRLYSTLLAHKKEHIRNFAAESFSFLMRKVPDVDGLFHLMLSDLEAHPEKARGAGQLVFEMCRGVRCMFHSCAEKAFPVALRKLGPSTDPTLRLPWDTVRDALDHMAQAAANHVDKEHFLVLWEALQRGEEPGGVTRPQVEEHLERLLFILHTLASHKDGAKVTKPQAVCQTVMQVIQTPALPASCCRLLLQITSSLLLGENISLPSPFIQEAVQTLFLPTLLRFSSGLLRSGDPATRHRGLEVLVLLILAKAPPPGDGSMAFEVYPLQFSGNKETLQAAGSPSPAMEEEDGTPPVPELVLSLIQLPPDRPISDLSLPWAALVLLPHLRPLAGTSVVPAVTDLLNHLLGQIEAEKLGKGDLYYTRLALGGLSEHRTHNALLELYQILHGNLSSNVAKIRLLTLRIFTHFEAELPVQAEAEGVPATVQDYREKLLHLRKLRHDLALGCIPQGPPGTFQQVMETAMMEAGLAQGVPLRYLIAMLFVNFRSHARGMENKSFWQVYYEHLQTVAGLAGASAEAGCDVIESGDVGVLFLERARLTSDPAEQGRTDFTNFRGQLWRAMTHFPECVEPRSRELSPLLLRFIRQLIAHLKVFAKFTNPRSLYMEPRLSELYLQDF